MSDSMGRARGFGVLGLGGADGAGRPQRVRKVDPSRTLGDDAPVRIDLEGLDMKKMKWINACVPMLSFMSCIGAPDTDDEGSLGEASLAFTIDNTMISVSESPANMNLWPKTVTWCVGAGHEAHGPFYWKVSWSGSLLTTPSNCISYPASFESCGLYAMLDHDSWGHTGDTNNPKYYSVFDHRDPITISPSSYSREVGQSVALMAPAPHCARHCDGAGTTVWQVKSVNNAWSDIAPSQNLCTWSTSSPTAGIETYRLKSMHQGYLSYSNEIVVTWSPSVSTCHAEVTCPNGSTVSCDGAPGTCKTSTYAATCPPSGNVCACTISCTTNISCDRYCGGNGFGRCSTTGCGAKYCSCIQ